MHKTAIGIHKHCSPADVQKEGRKPRCGTSILHLLQPVHLSHQRNVIRRVLQRRNRRVLLQQPLLVDLEVGQRRQLVKREDGDGVGVWGSG